MDVPIEDQRVEGPVFCWCHFFFCLFLAGVGGKVLFVRNVGIPVVPLWGCGWSFVTRTFELGGPGTSPGIRIDLKSLSRL